MGEGDSEGADCFEGRDDGDSMIGYMSGVGWIIGGHWNVVGVNDIPGMARVCLVYFGIS